MSILARAPAHYFTYWFLVTVLGAMDIAPIRGSLGPLTWIAIGIVLLTVIRVSLTASPESLGRACVYAGVFGASCTTSLAITSGVGLEGHTLAYHLNDAIIDLILMHAASAAICAFLSCVVIHSEVP